MAKIYAFDFDGTLCREEFPSIGAPNKRMIAYAIRLKKSGHRLILWTCRCGSRLSEAVDWCHKQGLDFDAVNENLPETIIRYGSDSRKITADFYIDDKTPLFPLLFFQPYFRVPLPHHAPRFQMLSDRCTSLAGREAGVSAE